MCIRDREEIEHHETVLYDRLPHPYIAVTKPLEELIIAAPLLVTSLLTQLPGPGLQQQVTDPTHSA
eukprot:2966730-Rhodomonas_salina.2